MFRFKISQKLLLLFLTVSLVPLAASNIFWLRSAQTSLKDDATRQQSMLTSTAVSRVNQFIADKVNLLIIHSQTVSIQSFDLPNSQVDIANLIKQDSNIQEVSLVDSKGIRQLAINRSGLITGKKDVSGTDAFRAATFLAGKEYISPVGFDTDGSPYVTIAVPLVTYDKGQSLLKLSTAEPGLIRTGQAIKGALIARISLTELWQGVLSQKLGDNGYAYVVDSQGTLIAYPDKKFLASHRDLHSNPQVASFIENPNASPAPSVTTSEKGEKVLSSYQLVPETRWGVIAEEPVSSIFAPAMHVEQMGILTFIAVTLIVIAMSYAFSRRLTSPIKRLATSAGLISQGYLDTRINNKSQDEIGMLARSFNSMAANLAIMLQQSRADSAKVEVILNNVGEGIVAVDGQGKIVLANTSAAVMVGAMPKNVSGHSFGEFFQWTREGRPFNPDLHKNNVYKDVVLVGANRRIHYLDVLLNEITDDPSGIRTIFTLIDKTDERELEDMKVDFVSMAAHELRTPMTAIRGYLNLILNDSDEPLSDQTEDRLNRIQSSSTQLVGLINNLLNVSRIERGALTLHFDKLDWAEMVRNAVNDQVFTANTKNVELTYEGPTEPVYILADHIAIVEVINNLISNAINYTGEGGKVTVTVEDTPKGIMTSVADTGIGISANAQKHLFTKFYRVHGGLASGSGGTGLGLYISKSIAEMHDGTITCDSVENEGTTFTIMLPHFDSDKYSEIIKNRPLELNKSRGWITKNTTR